MTVTIAHIRSHGVRQLLVYCRGRCEGDWPCHHEGTLPIERFSLTATLAEIEHRCRCTACGWRKADVRPDYSKPLPPRTSVGWMKPKRTRKKRDK
jgi:hypothetical protein